MSSTTGAAGKVVCVTGASGFIASWLVKFLLQRGYIVKATVRNLGTDPSKVVHLMALEGAKERLQLFEANLTDEGSFDMAVHGCDGVFHTASPVILNNINNPQAELIEPAVNGTLNVLRSCIKVPSIKRVVLTSSMAAVGANMNPRNSDTVIDETWFSDPIFCQENELWYYLSKTLAEENAMKFAEEHDIDIVVMNPGIVIGPSLQQTINIPSMDFLNFIRDGTSLLCPTGIALLVDIRDVCEAHILAFENPSAKGRYCLAAGHLHHSEVFNIIREFYPTLNLPKSSGNNELANNPFVQVSKEKAKSLGIKFIPMEQSVKDTIQSLSDKNLDLIFIK